MSNQTDNGAASPLLPQGNAKETKQDVQTTPVIIASVVNNSPMKTNQASSDQPNEYRFVHQRIPPKTGNLKFLLPILLLGFQTLFIVLFAVFVNYSDKANNSKYPVYEDLHAIALLGFGFIMTFLKRYGYGSIGFNLLLVAFVVQWSLLVRGWFTSSAGQNFNFAINLESLINADYTVIAVLVSLGALLGKTSLVQLVIVAFIEVVVQVVNEFINIRLLNVYDIGLSMHVHLFGAIFGLAVSKFLHFHGVKSQKQAPVYHSDLFALIGTLFLWVYYPSFNSLLSTGVDRQNRAIVNTLAAISASCVVTFGVSSLAGKGKLNVLHVQHATIAGGIAIGSVADLKVQIYIALIVGAFAGLLSTIGYKYIDPFLARVAKLHDTCSVQSLHGFPGLIAGIVSAIFAACSTFGEYKHELYDIYPARVPMVNSTEYFDQSIKVDDGKGRSGLEQAGFQLIAIAITVGISLVSGAITGLLLRLPLFEQLNEDVEMFDDEAQWVTPDDYALKLTFANPYSDEEQKTEQAQAQTDDSKV